MKALECIGVVGLLLTGSCLAQDSSQASPRSVFVGSGALLLYAYPSLRMEAQLGERQGVMLEGRAALPLHTPWYGGQLAFRHHFQDFERGWFVGGFVDYMRWDVDWGKERIRLSTRIWTVGMHAGGRWPVTRTLSWSFRAGLGKPFHEEYRYDGEKVDFDFWSPLDRMVYPGLTIGRQFSMLDGELGLEYGF